MYKVMKLVGMGLLAVSACASAYMLYKEVKRIKNYV
nr:MAG TPA: Lysis protein [Caudoviricetes sp.]